MKECATTLIPEMRPDEQKLLIHSMLSLKGERLHMEIGTAAGGTLCAMLSAFPIDRRPQFVVIDPMKYFPHQLETVQRNLREHRIDPSIVDFRQGTSAQAFPDAAARGDEFDFILVDGCHRIENVTLDLKWTRLLAVGGLICFHDYEMRASGVKMAVDRFLRRHPTYKIEKQVATMLVVRKTASSKTPEIDLSDTLYANFWAVPHRITRKLDRWRRAA